MRSSPCPRAAVTNLSDFMDHMTAALEGLLIQWGDNMEMHLCPGISEGSWVQIPFLLLPGTSLLRASVSSGVKWAQNRPAPWGLWDIVTTQSVTQRQAAWPALSLRKEEPRSQVQWKKPGSQLHRCHPTCCMTFPLRAHFISHTM